MVAARLVRVGWGEVVSSRAAFCLGRIVFAVRSREGSEYDRARYHRSGYDDERVDGYAVLGAGGGVDCGIGFVGGDSVGRMGFRDVGRGTRKNEKPPASESGRYGFRMCRYGCSRTWGRVLTLGQVGAQQCCSRTTGISAVVT